MALIDEMWTASQRRAIETVDRSVLVGAAAGSGKTAVLARRCAYLVAEAPPPLRCDVDELLVVTFTEAAASEMRNRVAGAIRDRLEHRPDDPRLRYQLAALDGAAVSTIHSFCRHVLTQWFALARIDPNFEVLDPDEQLLLRQEAVEQVFARLYDRSSPAGKRFRDLIDQYGDGYDRVIAERVIWLAEYVNSLVEPRAWLARARKWVAIPARDRLPAELGEEFIRRIRTELAWQHREAHRTAEWVRSSDGFVAERLESHAARLSAWASNSESVSADSCDLLLADIRDYQFPTLRGWPKPAKNAADVAGKEREFTKGRFDGVRNTFRERLQDRWCLFTVAEMADGLSRVGPVVQTLAELVDQYTACYQSLKERACQLDFSDLERHTFDLLAANQGDNEVTRSLRRKYRYVCVDEYQDVNPVQERIVRLVSNESVPQCTDNLFCVGDVKQSIYRFRLAEPGIFVARQDRFSHDRSAGEFIPLGDNFRSRSGLIDGINAVFERIMSSGAGPIDYDRDARLRAGLEYPEDALPCTELHLLERAVAGADRRESDGESYIPGNPAEWEAIEREAYCVGIRIRQLMGVERGTPRAQVCESSSPPGEPMTTRPLEFRDIVLLLRSARHKAVAFTRVFALMDIPVHAELATGYFQSTEVRDLLSLLALLDNRRQDIPLAAVMRSPLFDPLFDESDLLNVRQTDRLCPFHEAFDRTARTGKDRDLADRCATLARTLVRYRTAIRRRPVADVLWRIYTETGCLAYVSGLPGGRQRHANLIKLHERARQFGTFSRQGLFRFLRFIERLEDEGQDIGSSLPSAESDNVVRIMSVHASKGLEFPIVFLADLGKSFNFDDARGRLLASRACCIGPKVVDPLRRIEYPSVAHSLAADEIEAQTRAEEMRVLYVAMTRARERLILVGTASSIPADLHEVGADWAGHTGSLPPLTLSSARSYLDWLVPAFGCQRLTKHDDFADWLAVQTYTADRIRAWPPLGDPAKAHDRDRRALADLSPLPADEPIAEHDPAVERTLRRLLTSYPHDELTTIPSMLGVTELKRRHDTTRDPDDQTRHLATHAGPARLDIGWASDSPRELTGRERAAERGIATHRALELIDLRTAQDPDSLNAQIVQWIDGRLISREQADCIDRDAIRWFFQTQLGHAIRRAADELRREVMFVARMSPEVFDSAVRPADPADHLLVRGVIDALLPVKGGSQIIDYKTDRIDSDAVPARAEFYRTQLELYTRAAEELGAGPVTHRWLVFLTPRRVWELK